jgi:hypothetical protein
MEQYIGKPYTYLLKCLPTNQYYYGVRYAKNCNPDEFWITYFTSSKHIKSLIELYGKDSFEFQIRNTFIIRESAINWENKVLRRLKVIYRKDFINKTDNRAICPEAALRGSRNRSNSYSVERRKKTSEWGKRNKGRKQSDQQKITQSEMMKGNNFKLGKIESDETKLKKSLARTGKQYPKCSCTICKRVISYLQIGRHFNTKHSIKELN